MGVNIIGGREVITGIYIDVLSVSEETTGLEGTSWKASDGTALARPGGAAGHFNIKYLTDWKFMLLGKFCIASGTMQWKQDTTFGFSPGAHRINDIPYPSVIGTFATPPIIQLSIPAFVNGFGAASAAVTTASTWQCTLINPQIGQDTGGTPTDDTSYYNSWVTITGEVV